MSDKTSSGLLGAILIGGAIGSAILIPFAIFWKFGLHVLYEVAALLCILMWMFAEYIPVDSTYGWVASMPWWTLALIFGALGITTRYLAMRGHLPKWATGHQPQALSCDSTCR